VAIGPAGSRAMVRVS